MRATRLMALALLASALASCGENPLAILGDRARYLDNGLDISRVEVFDPNVAAPNTPWVNPVALDPGTSTEYRVVSVDEVLLDFSSLPGARVHVRDISVIVADYLGNLQVVGQSGDTAWLAVSTRNRNGIMWDSVRIAVN